MYYTESVFGPLSEAGLFNKARDKKINEEIRKCITDEYKFYFINLVQLIGAVKNTTYITVVGFKEKIDPKYKSCNLGAIVKYNEDKCKVLLNRYEVKGGNFVQEDIDKDLRKYLRFNSIFKDKDNVKESTTLSEGFLDKILKRKKEKDKKKDDNKSTTTTTPVYQPLSKDSEEYKDRVDQYNKAYKVIEKVVNKYKAKYKSGFGMMPSSSNTYYEDFVEGFDDNVTMVIGSIDAFEEYDKIKDLSDKEYREEVNKLWNIITSMSKEIKAAVENDKSIRGSVYEDGDKLDWEMDFKYKKKDSIRESMIYGKFLEPINEGIFDRIKR